MSDALKGLRIGFAMTGSFCTFSRAFAQAQVLRELGAELVPIMSENAAEISTRFGSGVENLARLREIAGREVITTIADAEPIGPRDMTDILLIAPCTSNTAAKLANGVNDAVVPMAVKSHLRGGKPVVLALATNDGLSGSARNIGELLNRRHYYFVPLAQDDIVHKPASLVAQFELIPRALEAALRGVQLRPLIT